MRKEQKSEKALDAAREDKEDAIFEGINCVRGCDNR